MKKNFIYVLIAGTIGFGACKKQELNTPQPQPAELPRELVKITYSNNPANPFALNYDQQGRLISATTVNGGQQFSYQNNTFSATFTDVNNFLYSELKNGKLDNAGRLLEADGIYHQPNQPDNNYKYVFVYDANGSITQMTQTNIGTGLTVKDEYVYTNGNITTDINTANGQANYRIEYTYYDSLPNKLSLDFQEGIVNFFTDGLTGKRSKNLKKTEQVFNAQNVKVLDYLFTYDMDAQGYPVKFTTKYLASNTEGFKTFEYNK